ncbi:uncharacterized protein LOC106674409 [Cimex lectularius]|uniref:Uncharacterized protein n=1 Tax=Cimex lectularius TaxID=79782 RepID=A0A8I6SJF8_CIMLE|nr:uncharacterized protein LOC106674409 [Cimex lectularius]
MNDKGVIKLTRSQAAEMQWKLIYTWPTKSDTWPYYYGLGALSVAASLSSIYISVHFKRKFKLGTFGNMSLMFPSIMVPPVILSLSHQKLVSEPILLQTECPVCIQFRSLMIQNLVGLGYPLLMAPTLSVALANVFSTMKLPTFSIKNIPEFYYLFTKLSKRLKLPLLFLFTFHSAISIYVANQEAYSLYTILDKLDSQN